MLLHLNLSQILTFLVPQPARFDCVINVPFFVLKTLEFKFSVFFYTLHNKAAYSSIKYIGKEKNVLLTVLTHTGRLFYQKMFYQSNIQCILILLLLFV